MDDDYDITYVSRGRKAGLVDLLVLSLHFVSELTSALHSTAVAAYNIAAQHANHRIDQEAFREQAALEIETLTGDDDG